MADKGKSAILNLEKKMAKLERTVAQVASGSPIVLWITTLAPEPFRLKRDIPILLRSTGSSFVASFLDANVNASGETEAEALNNLKEVLTMVFRKIRSLPPNTLGPGPSRQLAVLNEFVEAP
jgi:predicted RNase H-like HicB family nuclease